MTLCLISVNLVPDEDKVSTFRRGRLTIPESPTKEECISDPEEIADVERGVYFLIILGIAPFLVFLATYYLSPDTPASDTTQNSAELSGIEP